MVFKMSWIKPKITQHEKRQWTDTNAEMTQMLELSDKDLKAAIVMLQQPITSNLETCGIIESLSKEIKAMK